MTEALPRSDRTGLESAWEPMVLIATICAVFHPKRPQSFPDICNPIDYSPFAPPCRSRRWLVRRWKSLFLDRLVHHRLPTPTMWQTSFKGINLSAESTCFGSFIWAIESSRTSRIGMSLPAVCQKFSLSFIVSPGP